MLLRFVCMYSIHSFHACIPYTYRPLLHLRAMSLAASCHGGPAPRHRYTHIPASISLIPIQYSDAATCTIMHILHNLPHSCQRRASPSQNTCFCCVRSKQAHRHACHQGNIHHPTTASHHSIPPQHPTTRLPSAYPSAPVAACLAFNALTTASVSTERPPLAWQHMDLPLSFLPPTLCESQSEYECESESECECECEIESDCESESRCILQA